MAAVIAAIPPVITQMEQALQWIGFTAAQTANLVDDMGDLADMSEVTEKDIDTLASGFSKRTAADGRIHFGLNRTKRLKSLIHWVQDFERVSEYPSLDGMDQNLFQAALKLASERNEIRKQEADRSNALS